MIEKRKKCKWYYRIWIKSFERAMNTTNDISLYPHSIGSPST